ncbi:hypothetical protein [Gynuella sp.]|uniref:hypothetical protein n=1 Tax=Gynuella sp. TaxID=2969146 RepID=UPI003D0BD0D5
MRLVTALLISSLIILVSGCVSRITSPDSGPIAKLNVEVVNFVPGSLVNVESVYLTLNNADESWGGQQILKRKNPAFETDIPANEQVSYVINLLQGGGGFSSTCGIRFDLTAQENETITTKYELIRANSPVVIGCKADLYINDKLLGTYQGGSKVTRYVVETTY